MLLSAGRGGPNRFSAGRNRDISVLVEIAVINNNDIRECSRFQHVEGHMSLNSIELFVIALGGRRKDHFSTYDTFAQGAPDIFDDAGAATP